MDDLQLQGTAVESELKKNGVYASVTSGVSMRPLFKTHRDMVILKKPNGVLKKYDVVLYKAGAKYLLHRIIKVDTERNVYVIRGDNTFKLEYVPLWMIFLSLCTERMLHQSKIVLRPSLPLNPSLSIALSPTSSPKYTMNGAVLRKSDV